MDQDPEFFSMRQWEDLRRTTLEPAARAAAWSLGVRDVDDEVNRFCTSVIDDFARGPGVRFLDRGRRQSFVKLHRTWRATHPDAPLDAWFRRAARSHMKSASRYCGRRTRREAALDEDAAFAREPDPVARLTARRARMSLLCYALTLPPKSLAVFVGQLLGMNLEEIATELSIAIGNVKRRGSEIRKGALLVPMIADAVTPEGRRQSKPTAMKRTRRMPRAPRPVAETGSKTESTTE